MDDEAERLKKLKAGKERLAAFQKKKIKKKKKSEANSEGVSDGVEVCLKQSPNVSHSEEQLLAAAPATSVHTDNVLPTDSPVLPSPVFETSSSTLDLSQSDIAGAGGDSETSLQEPERQQLFETAQLELREASSKINKLEESVIGKQKAVERLVSEINSLRAENEMLKQSVGNGPSQDLNALDPASKYEPGHQRDLILRIQELENAILKRDELLRQLTSRLQMSFQENTERGLQQACSVETQKLAQHVQLLQLQLQQAGEKLNGQMKQHSVSSQALQDAKCEILNLHQRIQQKDEMMSQLAQKLTQMNNDYASLQSTMALSDQQSTDYKQLLTELNVLQEQSNTLSLHLNEEKANNVQLEKRLMQVLQPNVNDESVSASNGSLMESTAEGTVAEMELTSENLPEYFPRKQLEEFHRLIEKCIFLYQSSDNTSDSSNSTTTTTTTSSSSSSISSREELNRLLLKITCVTQVFLKNIKTDSFQRLDLDRDFACQVDFGENLMLVSNNNSEMLSRNAFAINDNLGVNSALAEDKELLSNAETLQLKIEDLATENKFLSEEVFQTKTKFDSLLAVKEELEERCQVSESKTSELIVKLEQYETEINSLQEKNSNVTACLKDLEASFGSVQESEVSLTENVAVLKSEKEALNACIQEKDRDIQDLTERLESSHQEIMNLENMRRTLEQELSMSQQETVDFKDKLNRHDTEAEEQKRNDLNLLEKLASSHEEIATLQQQIASIGDEKNETLKIADLEVARLNKDITVLRDQIAEMEENNSQQMKRVVDQQSHLEEVNLQLAELTATVEKTKMMNQSLMKEKETISQWNVSVVKHFSKITSLIMSVIGEDTDALDLCTTSNDEDLGKVEAVVNEMSSKVTKHKENLLRLESENKSLAEFRIQEKEEADKLMKERSNEIAQYQETVSALEAEKQSLSKDLAATENNCKSKDLEIEKLKCEVVSLQVTESTKERFAEMDTLLVQRQQENNQLTEELTSLKQSSSKDLATLRKNVEEFEEKIKGKDECVRNLTHQLDEEKELVISLTQQTDSRAEEIEKLRLEISSLQETGELAKVNFEESHSKIEKFENDIVMLKSVNENYHQELEKVTTDKKTLESNFEELRSSYSSLECDNTELKQSLDKIESEKKQLQSMNEDLSKVVEEKNKLLQELEEFHKKEKEDLQEINESLKTKIEALESVKNHIQNVYDETVQNFLVNQENLRKLHEEHVVLEDHFKVQSEEFILIKKEFEDSKEASSKRISDLEKLLLEVESNASSEKASMNKEVQEFLAMKESLLVKIEELSRSSGSGEAQLLASREAVSQVLGKANDELESFKELWSIEKTELCNKIRSLSAELENLQQEKDGSQQVGSILQLERENLHYEEEGLQHEKQSLLHEKEGLQDEKKNFQQEKGSLQHEMERLQQEKESLQQEQINLQHEKNGLHYQRESLQYEKDGLQHEKDSLHHEKENLQQEKQGLQQERDSWLQEKESIQQQNNGLLQENKGLEEEKNSLLQKNKSLQQEKDFLLQENASLHLKEGQQDNKISLLNQNKGLQSKEKKGFENEGVQSEEKYVENEGLRWDNHDLEQPQQEQPQTCLQASVAQTCEANPQVVESFESKDLNVEHLESLTVKPQGVEVPLEECKEDGGTTVDSSSGEGSSSTVVNGTETSIDAVDALGNYKDQLETMAEKYEMELKYVRMSILADLSEEKENLEKELEQRYNLKLESVKAENDRMFIENLQKKLAESRDSLLKQIELLNTQYEQIQEEHFSLWSKRSKKPMSSSPRAKRKFDTLPRDIESASRSLVEISRAKGCFDNEEKTCTKLDCQGYRKRYEIALKILTEKGLTSLDNISEKSSFEVDSLDGSTSMGDQPREELSMELQDEYNELMERTITEPVLSSSTFQRKSSPELQCSNCINLAEERLSLKKRLSTQLELFGKERFHLLSRSENLSIELENVMLTRDQLQTELNIMKEIQQGQDRHPSAVELTDIKVKLANTEDQVVFYQNKLSQSEIEHQQLKSKINDLFVKVIDQQHYINNLEEEYSRSQVVWNHKGTMTSTDNDKIELAPLGARRHSEPSGNEYNVLQEMGHHHSVPQHLSQSINDVSSASNFANIPQMPSPKSPKSDRETSPDSLNKSSISDNSSPAGDRDNWINYHSEHTNRNSSSPALNQSDRYSDTLMSPRKLTRSTQSSPSLLLLNKEFRESEKILSEFQLDQGDFLFVQDKQIELIDEIAELKRSLLQSKEEHTKEIATIKEQIDRYKKAKGLSDTQSLLNMLESTDIISLSVDVVDLRQKVSLLRETCNRLTEDNKDLQKKLYNQECLVMKAKMLQTNPKHSVTAEDLETSFGSQLLLLQKHRDELAEKLSEERLLENQFTEVVAAKTSLDEHLRQEKEHVQQLTERVQIVEAELSSKKSEYDRLLQQQLHLEELIRNKEEVEKELMSEKYVLESKLNQSNYDLEIKEKLLKDIEQRVNKCASEMSPEVGVTAGNDNEENNIALQERFTQELNEAKLVIEKQNIDRLESLRKDMDEHHKRAVEYLRQQLRSDFSMRESRLEEHHAAHVASLHSIHAEQLQNLKDEYETQMEDLKQEFYNERIKHVRSNISESQASGSNDMDEGSNGAVDNKQEAILDELRKDLTEDQQHKLELVISQIVKQHQVDLDQLTSHYKDELNLRIKATRLTAEQLHKSQAELMKASLEEKKQNELAELRDILARYHNEEIDRREGEWSSLLEKLRQQYNYQLAIGQEPAPKGALGTLEGATLVSELTKRLNDEHKKLIEVISKDLVPCADSQTTPENAIHSAPRSISSSTLIDCHGGSNESISGAADASTNHWRMSDTNSNYGDAIYKCLEEQKDEILLLRVRILKEYEQLMKVRTDSMVTESSKDIMNLQDEIDALQQQHEIQISTMRQRTGKISSEHTGESSLSQSLDEDQRQSLSKMLSHYENKVHSIEERFNHHMSKLKSQIEHDLTASFGDFSGDLDHDFSFGKMSLTKTGRFSQLPHQAEFSASSVEKHVPVDSQIVAEEAFVLNDTNNSSLIGSDSNDAMGRASGEHGYIRNANSNTYVGALQEQLADVQNQYVELSASESHLPKESADMNSPLEKALKAQEELLEQEHKLEMDALQSECEIKLQVELKKQAIELLEKFQAGLHSNDKGSVTLKRCESFERELIKRTMTDGQFDSYDASDNCNNIARAHKERLGVPVSAPVLWSKNTHSDSNSSVADYEAQITLMQSEFEQYFQKLRTELTELSEKEKQAITTKFQKEITNLKNQLADSEEKYENLMDELRSGKIPEVAQLMHEKYDAELEFAKALMQQEFDESLEGEQSRQKEQQEKQIQELLFEKTNEMKELQQKYEENLISLQETLRRYEDHTNAKDDTDGSNDGNKQQQQKWQKQQDEQLKSLRLQLEEKDKIMEAERKSLEENYNQELEKLREKYEQKLSKQQKCLTESHDDQLSAMVIHSDAIKSELDEAHQAELEQVREQLSSKHSKMMDNLNKKHQMNLEELEKQYQIKIEELEIRHQMEVECLKKEMENLDAKEESCISTTNVATQCQLIEEQVIPQECGAVESSPSNKATKKEIYEETNKQLLQHLSNLVRTYLDIEDSINKKLSQVLADSKNASEKGFRSNHLGIPQSTSDNGFSLSKRQRRRYKSAERLDVVKSGSEETFQCVSRARSMDPIHPFTSSRSPFEESRKDDPNMGSSIADEGLVLSQQFGNNIFSGPGLDSDSEELINDTSNRIQTSIMRLLEMMEETTQQLLDSKSVQQELMDTLNMRDSEAQDRSQRLQDLTEQLKQEINAREQLALELHKAQGLVEGFTEERKSLSSTLKDHEDREAVLVMENETLRNQVHDLQLSESEVTSLRKEVQRQQSILYENAGREQQGLLDEIRQLNDDKRLMSQLVQQNQDSYENRIRELLGSGEDMEHRYSELLEEKRQQVDDLKLQLEAVDRQLKANKQFLNEQAHEREQEREEFQKEINQWRNTVQQMERQQNTEIRLKNEVEELSDQLESRISSQSQMLMKKEQLERDIQDKDLNAQELKQLVEQLEQELDEKVTKEKQQEQKILQLEEQINKLQEINEELSQEMKLSTTGDKKIICDLETQLGDQRLVYEKKALTLDEELKKARRIEEEISSEKAALEQHVCDNLLQIASLKNQLDEYRQRKLSWGMLEESPDSPKSTPAELAAQLQTKENEIKVLSDMVDKLELQVERKNEELIQLKKRQNGDIDDNKDGEDEDNDDDESDGGELLTSQLSIVSENATKVLQLKEENELLKSQVSSLKQQVTNDGFSSLTQQLLDEKNEQIDQLRNHIAEQAQSNPLFSDFSSENSELKEQLQKKVTEIEEKDSKLHSLTALVEELQTRPYVSDESFMGDMSLPFEQGSPYMATNSMTERTSLQQELSAVITDRDQQINTLQTELEQKEDKSKQMHVKLMLEHEKMVTSLREVLQERDTAAEEMCTEIDGLHAEITNLSEHQAKLQEDFDTVQGMLEGKDKEIDELTKEVSELRSEVDNSDVVMRYEVEAEHRKKKVKELENVIEEKMEENYTLNEKIEEMGNLKDEVSQLRTELEKEKKLVESKNATLQNLERRVESSNKVIGQLQQREDHWQLKYSQTELQLREREEHLHQLQNEVMEREESDEKVRQRLNVAEQQVGVQQHNIQALQSRVSDSEARLKESRETISELKDTLASLEEEKEQMAGRMTSKDALIAKLQEQLHHLEKKSHDQAVEISQREKSYMTLVKMHQEKDELISIEEGRTLVLRAEVDDLQNELILREEEQSKVQAELDECKIRLDNLTKSVADNKVTAINSAEASNSPRRSSPECEGEDGEATVSKLQSDLETSQHLVEEKSQEIKNLQTELEERNTQLNQQRLSVEIEKKKSEQLHSKCEQLQNELQEAWEMKLVNDNHIDDLKKKLFKLESEELKPSNAQSLEDTQVIQSKFTDLWQEIQKRESDVERLEMELVEANVKVRSQEAEMQHSSLQTGEDGGQLSEQINLLLGKLEASQVDIESKKAKIVSYENELQIKDSMLQELQQQLEKSASSYHSSKLEYHTLLGEEQIEATKAEGRIVVLRSEVDDLQKQLVTKETELQTVRDHLMDTQIQLVNRAQEMTRICQHRNTLDEDLTDSASSKSVHQEKSVSEDTKKKSDETANMKPQLPEALVHRLESELEKTRSLLHLRIGQLEEKNQNSSGTSEHNSVISHIKQVYNELISMRTILEQLCQDKATQQTEILAGMSDNQQERIQSVEMLQELSASSPGNQTGAKSSGFGAPNVVWGAASVESPEFRPVVPNKQVQKPGTTTKPTNVEPTLYGTNDAQIQEHLKVLLSRIQKEGIQTLTLSELQFIRYHTTPKPTARNIDIEALRTAWEKERQTLLSAIQALKELLAQEQQLATPDWELSSTNVDWRQELLHTLSHVFMRERDVLLSELRSYVLINSDGTDLSAVQRLEQKIIEQECQQKASLEQVICADRQSLVSEVRDMKAKLAIMQLQHHDDKEQLTDKLQELEKQRIKREEHLQRHIKLLEYRLEQSRVIQDDLHSSIEMERRRTSELASELTKSKAHAMDLNGEVTNLQVNIAKVKDAFEQEHSRYLSLIAALEEEKIRTTELTERLESEKENVRHLQDDLENITGQLGKERDLEYQHLYLALENEKEKLKDSSAVAHEKQAENLSLQQELEAERLRCQSITAKYDVTVAQLNSRLADEQSLNEQLTSNLTKERNLNIQLKQSLDKVCSIRQDTCERDRATITDLQIMLETERSSVADLQRQLESVREERQTRISSLIDQQQSVKESLEKETAKFHKLKVKSDIYENQQSDLQRQLDYEKERTIRLQAEKHSLTLELQTLRQREKERYITAENEKLTNNRKVKEMSRQLENQKVVVHQNELEVERLQEKVQGLETDLQNSRLHERQLVHEIEYTKLRSPENLKSFTSHIMPDVMTTTTTSVKPDTKEKEKLLSAFKSQLENIRQCLESAGMTFQDCLNKITSYLKVNQMTTQTSPDSFNILCSMTASVDDMLSDLRELQMSLTLEAQEGPGYPNLAAIINQRTLQHNRELLSSIFKLSEEKLALRAQLLECEECIQNYKTQDYIRQTQNSDGDVNSLLETSFTMERIRWDQERATYELALQNCEKRIEQLQRNLRIERTHGFALSNNNNTTTTTNPNINNNHPLLMESDLIQTLFRKYFRAESFRKALIYQKNYLLVLLGGFQDSEQTVLALLSRMNARCNNNRLSGESYNQGQHNRCHPLARFRSAARVIIAISRMKYLMRKLQQACTLSLSGVLNLSPQHRGKIKHSGHTVPCSSSTSTTTSSTFSAPLEGATAATSPHSNPFMSTPYCSLKLRTSRPRPTAGHSPPAYQSSVRHMVNTSTDNVQRYSPSSLATPPIKTNVSSLQSRFMTPPTKEVNHLRGALEKVPSLYQLTEDHSDHHTAQQNLSLSNHQPMLGLPSSTNNGDIPLSSNCDRQAPDDCAAQHCDDLSQHFEQVQSNVDQVRHSPQIERQRHRRKYDGFHQNIDL